MLNRRNMRRRVTVSYRLDATDVTLTRKVTARQAHQIATGRLTRDFKAIDADGQEYNQKQYLDAVLDYDMAMAILNLMRKVGREIS